MSILEGLFFGSQVPFDEVNMDCPEYYRAGDKVSECRCIDNGPMEGYWGIIKSEMYYLKKFTSKENLIDAIEAYIVYYNNQRYQLRLNCMTPVEYHEAYAA